MLKKLLLWSGLTRPESLRYRLMFYSTYALYEGIGYLAVISSVTSDSSYFLSKGLELFHCLTCIVLFLLILLCLCNSEFSFLSDF